MSSDSDSSEEEFPSKRFPLHDAAERGDIETLKALIAVKEKAKEIEANGAAAVEGNNTVMNVEVSESKEGHEAGEEDEEEHVNSDDDQSYHGEEEEDEEDEDMVEDHLFRRRIDLNEKDNFNCTALHVAIHARQTEAVKVLVEAGADVGKKTEGSTPLHTAIAVGSLQKYRNFALEMVHYLVEHGAEVNVKDDAMQTPLHLAAFHGLQDCAHLLLEKGAMESLDLKDRLGNRPLHVAAKNGHPLTVGVLMKGGGDPTLTNLRGMTPLHYACENSHWECVRTLLSQEQEAGAKLAGIKDKKQRTAGQTALANGHSIPQDLCVSLGMSAAETNKTPSPEKKATLLVQDPSCSQHLTCTPIVRSSHCDPPPENVNRLHVLINPEDGILRGQEFSSCEWITEAPKAQLADLLRVHDYDYITRIMKVCDSLPESPYAIGHLDGDTAVSKESWEAALKAAGAACLAVDRVLKGENRNAFCAVRPPGHHAGSRGVVKCDPTDQGSHGFCLVNNVAVAASYARHVYRHQGVKRLVICDFDVHHGNGTEEIVENIVPHIEEIHVGREILPWCESTFRATKFKPWLNEDDHKEVLFVSVHGYGGRNLSGQGAFYPGSGVTKVPAITSPSTTSSSVTKAVMSPDDEGTTTPEEENKEALILDVGMKLIDHDESPPGTSRVEWRRTIREIVLPRIARFEPNLILISAGFDAHKKDCINMGYIGLLEEDYEWITRHLVRVANTFCQGRVVSVLEGGYKIQGGLISAFARSVASHVRALVEGSQHEEGYDEEDLRAEQALEQKQYDIKVRKFEEKLQEREASFRRALLGGLGNDADDVIMTEQAAFHTESANEVEDLKAEAAALAAEAAEMAATATTEEPGGGGRRKRRAAAVKVDYVALAKKMKEEERKAEATDTTQEADSAS